MAFANIIQEYFSTLLPTNSKIIRIYLKKLFRFIEVNLKFSFVYEINLRNVLVISTANHFLIRVSQNPFQPSFYYTHCEQSFFIFTSLTFVRRIWTFHVPEIKFHPVCHVFSNEIVRFCPTHKPLTWGLRLYCRSDHNLPICFSHIRSLESRLPIVLRGVDVPSVGRAAFDCSKV